ncbi:MAG: endonuclease NucS domain-containing protein [Limisphaerales bacterium]
MPHFEFYRTIGSSEVHSGYLNLTDDSQQTYGTQLPAHRTRLAIIDGAGHRTNAAKHHDNQIWSGLNNWYQENNVVPGTRIKVRYDEAERSTPDGLHVLHLEVVNSPSAPTVPTPPTQQIEFGQESPDTANELPLSLERQLEDFLALNLGMIETGLQLYRDEDGREGRQYPTDVGEIDLLCNRPNQEILVVELKRGRSSDIVVGQISRYMGWVKRHIANGRVVKGLILTYEQDDKLRYAVAANPNIELKRFKLRLEIIPDEEL